jgi:hypothetical protein
MRLSTTTKLGATLSPIRALRNRVALATLASCILLGAIFASGALALENSSFVKYTTPLLTQQMSLTTSQAERDLQTQQAAGNIVPQLEKKLGSDYAGVWFDLQTGLFHVGVLSQTDRSMAEETMNDAGVLGSTIFDSVQYKWNVVEDSAKSWDTKLSSLVGGQQAIVIPDPRIDGVTIGLASNLPADTVTQTDTATVGSSVPTRVVPLPPTTLEAHATSCKFPYCERPVRGGVGIISTPENGAYKYCTAGFFVRDANNYPYILTAAHCVYPKNSTYWKDAWGTAYPGGLTGCGLGHMIAQVLSTAGDAAVIETEGCEPPVPEPAIAAWNIEETYYIKPEPYTAYVGLFECHMGQTSQDQCGYVEAVNLTENVNYTDIGEGHINVEHMDWLCARTEPGDSGGPYASGHWGTAIDVAGGGGSCSSYGFELRYALSALGVHLPTS